MDVALLGPGDDLVDVAADGLGAGIDRLDSVVREQGAHKAALHGLGVRSVGAELHALLLVVTHNCFS